MCHETKQVEKCRPRLPLRSWFRDDSMSLGRAERGSHSNPAISQLGDLGASCNSEVSATLADMLGKLPLPRGVQTVRINHP